MKYDLRHLLAQQQPITPVLPGKIEKPAESPSGGLSGVSAFGSSPMLIFIGALFIGMYFIVIRPQRKEEKRRKELLGSIKKGDAVITSSGILGTIQTIKDSTVIVKVGDNTRMEFLRSAISEVRNKEKPATAKSTK